MQGARAPRPGVRLLPQAVTCAVALALLAAGCGGSKGAAAGSAASDRLISIGAGLEGVDGLRAGVYASGVPHVSAFALDARGRLWLTAAGSSTHRGDGVYVIARKGAIPVRVVAGMKAPLGLVWHGGTLYVSSLGRVDAFSGLQGSHFSRRVRIVAGPVAGGENNNIVLAPDGRLLIGVSASCDHCVPSSRYSAAIVSFRADGSGLAVYASGIRAAYGLAFVPGTSDLYASMNQRDDLGAKTPGDWLGQVAPGEDWGFPACYGQGGNACTGVPAPVAVLDKHAAAGGVAILTSGTLGATDGSPLALVSEWELGTVKRVDLSVAASASPRAAAPYLSGLTNPLPLLTTRTGTLLVGDWATGKIYTVTGG
jgi:glucose/arabinose dehydrogenase